MRLTIAYEIRGNLLLITKYPLHLFYKLRDVFTYKKIGYDRETSRRTITPETVASGYDEGGNILDLYGDKVPKTIITFRGYEDALVKWAVSQKLEVDRTETKLTDDKVFVPVWDEVPDSFEFRYMQKETLELMGRSPGGLILCSVGWGKSEVLGLSPVVFPKARILISSYRAQVYSTIGERIRKYVLPGTKYFIQGGKVAMTDRRIKEARVVVCGNKTLPRVLGYSDKWDIFCCDEVHLAAADDTFNVMSTITRPKMFGFTGSPNRSDGAQFRLHGLFGPTLMEVDMRKAKEKGMVVPIKVLWCPVKLQYDPIAKCHSAYKKHKGIWFNVIRNKLIAGAANSYDEDTQVLIIVETIKHAMALRSLLPNYLVVSSETENLDRARGAFKKGTLKRVIATGVWREGVDFPDLGVLINATGVKSEIANIQLTGRVTRLGEQKEYGVVHDFYDHWNPQFASFSAERKKIYEKQGFEQTDIQPTELLKNI